MKPPYNNQLDAFELYHLINEEDASRSKLPDSSTLPALGSAISGATGSAISHILLYPLDLVITRLQVQKQLRSQSRNTDSSSDDADDHSLFETVRQIYDNEGGLQAFYSGVTQDTIKSVADSFLFFLAYTFIRETRRKRLNSSAGTGSKSTKSLSLADELGVGILAGAFSRFITMPIQNIVTRKQTASMTSGPAFSTGTPTSPSFGSSSTSVKTIALQIRREKGIQGFWTGYPANLVLTLNPSLTFLLQTVFARWLLTQARRDKPSGAITFFLAAMSKVVATSVTYPFSLAKARAQVRSPHGRTQEGFKNSLDKQDESSSETKMDIAKAKKAMRQSVFGVILLIIQTESIDALYNGLLAQLLKGFFEHGLTMMMKERILTIVQRLYKMLTR